MRETKREREKERKRERDKERIDNIILDHVQVVSKLKTI